MLEVGLQPQPTRRLAGNLRISTIQNLGSMDSKGTRNGLQGWCEDSCESAETSDEWIFFLGRIPIAVINHHSICVPPEGLKLFWFSIPY